MRLFALPALSLLLATPAAAQTEVGAEDRYLHERMIVIDTHLDIPARFDAGDWDFGARHNQDWDRSQADLPRMEEGGLDGGFFVIYTAQGEVSPTGYREARDRALVRATAIHRVLGENQDKIGLALTAEDAERMHEEGRRFAFISMENSWPLGEDLSLLSTFHRLGLRMAGPVHSRDNQFGDSTTGEGRWKGLSPLGRQWVAEMNRLGIIIDGSHSSDAAFDQMLELSRAPIVLSHSGPKALHDHPRNIDDERLRRLAKADGILFINSLFLADADRSPERSALNDRLENWAKLDDAERRRLLRDRAALDAKGPATAADFDLYMKSILHAIRVMGVDHVGLGADWDGGGGVSGMNDITALPRITARLRREGYSEADIAKVMGGNLLRVMRAVQAAGQAS